VNGPGENEGERDDGAAVLHGRRAAERDALEAFPFAHAVTPRTASAEQVRRERSRQQLMRNDDLMSRAQMALMFAALWTASTFWWNAPLDAAEIVGLTIGGAVSGAVYAWLMAKRFGRQRRRGR
jgi:hypothetical protein